MKSLMRAWPQLAKQISGKHLLLLLDYDGTLTPIQKKPQQAILETRMRDQLRKLAKTPDITLGIVSGRDFDDIRRRVGIKGLIYASNHGFKIRGKGIDFETPISCAVRKALTDFQMKLAEKIKSISGTLIEKKKFSFALHYRLVQAKELPKLKRIFYGLLKIYGQRGLEVTAGKKVIEVMPALNWNKGKAVLRILSAAQALHPTAIIPLYIGDDATDEYAFKALRKNGVGVHVGAGRISLAKYHLRDVEAVRGFLAQLRFPPS